MYFNEELKTGRILLITDIHFCHAEWHGLSSEERMELALEKISKVYERSPFDMILCLGDYSLDFWGCENGGSYLREGLSNTARFVSEVKPRLPAPCYMIPGNHEQYSNEKFLSITGYPREFAVRYGNNVFLMLDTFGGNLDPAEHSDGTYSGVNLSFVKKVIRENRGGRFFLCAHDIMPESENKKLWKILKRADVPCAFLGHTHKNNILFPTRSGSFPLVYCGNLSYSCTPYETLSFRLLNIGKDLLNLELHEFDWTC